MIYAAGLIPLYMVREPPGPPPRPPRPFRDQLGELPGVLRGDRQFRRFLSGLCIAARAPLLGGQIVAWGGYGWLFGLSAAVALVAVLTLGEGVRAPEKALTPQPPLPAAGEGEQNRSSGDAIVTGTGVA